MSEEQTETTSQTETSNTEEVTQPVDEDIL